MGMSLCYQVSDRPQPMSANVLKKLGVKPGMQLLVLNAPSDVLELLGDLPPDVTTTVKPAGLHDFVLGFVRSKVEVDSIGAIALKASKPEGALWFAYPKKTGKIKTDLSRDSGWDLLSAHGYRPVSQIAIDETWTGFRFRPVERVKTKPATS